MAWLLSDFVYSSNSILLYLHFHLYLYRFDWCLILNNIHDHILSKVIESIAGWKYMFHYPLPFSIIIVDYRRIILYIKCICGMLSLLIDYPLSICLCILMTFDSFLYFHSWLRSDFIPSMLKGLITRLSAFPLSNIAWKM